MPLKPVVLAILAGLGLTLPGGPFAGGPAQAAEARGIVRVLDGDTLELAGRRLRLHGIDAPEPGQLCSRDGVPWPCGAEAALLLRRLVAGREVACRTTGRVRDGVVLAACRLGWLDLSAELLTRGMAVPDPPGTPATLRPYREARSLGEGIFAGEFIAPARWRRGERLPIEQTN